jgi:Peroxiredoxin
VAAGVIGVVAASFVVPGAFSKKTSSPGAEHAMNIGAEQGAGLPVGSSVPAFSERNVETGQLISSKSVYAKKTLLFFSEGVMCQACFEQIKGLERFGAKLQKRGIQLISITPDTPGDLKQAISQYGITTPMIADDDTTMSEAFNTLGQGMHGDTPGHAFALIDKGKVLWYRDYWLPPARAMYVEPAKLLSDIPSS